MSLAKKVMMDKIRQGLGLADAASPTQHRLLSAQQWLARRPINVAPSLPQHPQAMVAADPGHNLTMFVTMAERAGAAVMAETALENIPALINQFIIDKKLPNQLVIMDPALEFLKTIMVEEQDISVIDNIITRPATVNQVVSLTLGRAAIAESGTIMVASRTASNLPSPSRLYFLPIAHIVMLSCQQIVEKYEDALSLLDPLAMPRGLHFITGPSRTADIDQTITTGMHGPKELLIILTP
ncbi:MAG: LUD domain-containing protein [Hydrotalea sp.]|nr:LUD domain-containing protein [Hydrotalea sp.]